MDLKLKNTNDFQRHNHRLEPTAPLLALCLRCFAVCSSWQASRQTRRFHAAQRLAAQPGVMRANIKTKYLNNIIKTL
jgi:hypothetical protein